MKQMFNAVIGIGSTLH